MDNGKRKRSPNFTPDEIDRLISIVSEFQHVVKDKTVNATTWKAKEIAWQNIAENFNLSSSSGLIRTPESLKKAFDNKKEYRMKVAKMESIEKNSNETVIVPFKNRNLIVGTPIIIDSASDNTTDSLEKEIVKLEENTIIREETVPIPIDCEDASDNYFLTPISENLQTKQAVVSSSSNFNLRVGKGPVVSNFQVPEHSKEYSELMKIKIEYANLEKKMLEDKIISNYKESIIRLRGMELDNLIKEAQLKKMNQELNT